MSWKIQTVKKGPDYTGIRTRALYADTLTDEAMVAD